MKLSEFVRNALNEIADGVIDATEDIAKKTKNHPIAPAYVEGKLTNTNLTNIDFEVSTIVKDLGTKSGEIKSEIWVVGIGGEYEKTTESQNITKIKFSVPVIFSALKKPK